MSKKIIIFEPSGAGGLAHYTYKLCKGFEFNQIDYHLITARPYELAGLMKSEKFSFIIGRISGIGLLGKIYNKTIGQLLYFLSLLLHIVKNRKSKILITSSPRKRTLIYIFILIRFLCAYKPIYVLHDPIPHIDKYLQSKVNKLIILSAKYVVLTDKKFINIASEYYRVKKSKFRVINIGSNLIYKKTTISKNDFKKKLQIPLDAKVLLFFGTIADYKGIFTLLEVFKKTIRKHSFVYLVIAGNLSKEIKRNEFELILTNKSYQDKVKTELRYIPPNQHSNYFNISDIIALPYEDSQLGVSQSGVLMNGLDFGKPIIATNVSALSSGVVNKFNGLLIEKPFEENFANGLTKLLNLPEIELKKMGSNSIKLYNKSFSWNKIARLFYKLIDE